MSVDTSETVDPREDETPRRGRHPRGSRETRGPLPASAAPLATPVVALDDPRAVQILSSEFSNLDTARSLAYNEALTRGGMFLSFLSMSFVGIALVAQVLPVGRDLLLVVAIVLSFDLVLGLTSYGRMIAANYEDYRAVQGMARIRHAYSQVAPVVEPYFVNSKHDDLEGVMVAYGTPPTVGIAAVLYGLSTSGGMIGTIVALIGGVLAISVCLLVGLSLGISLMAGAAVGLAILAALVVATVRYYGAVQGRLTVLFPTPRDETSKPSTARR